MRAAARTVLAVLGLLVVAASFDLVLGLVQATMPRAFKGCPDHTDAVIGRPQQFDLARCEVAGRRDLKSSRARTAAVDVSVREDAGSVVTTLRMALPKDDPLVRAARSGELSRDPYATAVELFGTVSPTTRESWRGPAVELRDGAAEATVSMATVEDVGMVRERRVSSPNGGLLTVTLEDARITSVKDLGDVMEQSPTTLRARLREGDVATVNVRPPKSPPSAVTVISDLDWLSTVWFVVKEFVWPGLLSAVPWLVVLVLQRRRTELWRRFRSLLAVLLIGHAALVGFTVVWIVDQAPAYTLQSWLPFTSPNRLSIARYASIPGAIVLLLCCLTFLATYAAHHYRRRAGVRPDAGFTRGWTVAALVLWACGVGVYAWALGDQSFGGFFQGAAALGVVVPLFIALVGVGFAGRRIEMLGMFWGLALLAPPLAVLATLHDRIGLLPSVLRVAIPIAAAVTALLALTRLLLTTTRTSRIPAVAWWVIGLFAVALSVPLPLSDTQWHDLTEFAHGLDSLLATSVAIALAYTLYRAEKTSTVISRTSVTHRRLALACAFVVLSGAFSFTARTSLVFLAAAAAGAWWLLPRKQRDNAARLERMSMSNRRAAVERLVNAGEARRLLTPLRKTLRDKAAGNEVDFVTMSDRVTEVEQVAAGRRKAVDGLTLEERALGTSTRPSRLTWGAVVGVIVGLPWTAVALYGVLSTASPSRGYPILGALTDIGPQLLRWAAYGVLFAHFLPLIRGRTGLAKSISLFVAISLPTIVDTLPSGVGADGWQTVTLAVVQAFSFAMSIGLLADRDVLLAHGYESSRLADIHNLGAFAAWASSIAISLGTAVATALLVGLQPFLIPNLEPTPATPPVAPAEAPQ